MDSSWLILCFGPNLIQLRVSLGRLFHKLRDLSYSLKRVAYALYRFDCVSNSQAQRMSIAMGVKAFAIQGLYLCCYSSFFYFFFLFFFLLFLLFFSPVFFTFSFFTLLSRFLVCFSFWLFNIVVHHPTYVKKWKEVQMLLFQTSREIKFYFQHFIQVCFYFLGKNWGGARPLPLLRHWNLEMSTAEEPARRKDFSCILHKVKRLTQTSLHISSRWTPSCSPSCVCWCSTSRILLQGEFPQLKLLLLINLRYILIQILINVCCFVHLYLFMSSPSLPYGYSIMSFQY